MRTFWRIAAGWLLAALASAVAAADVQPARPRPAPMPSAQPVVKDAAGYFQEGMVYLERKQYALALNAFSAAVRLKPNYPEAYSKMGYCHRKLRNHKLAFQYFEWALRLKPDLVEAHLWRGELLAETGRLVDAQKEVEILKKLDPSAADRLDRIVNRPEEITDDSGDR